MLLLESRKLGGLLFGVSTGEDWLKEGWSMDEDMKLVDVVVECLLDNSNLLNDLSQSFSQNNDLLSDDRLLRLRGLWDRSSEGGDLSLDDVDLSDHLSDDSSLVNDLLSDLLNLWLIGWLNNLNRGLSNNVEFLMDLLDLLSDDSDLLLDLLDGLSNDVDLLDDLLSLFVVGGLDNLGDQVSLLDMKDLDFLNELDDFVDLVADNFSLLLDDSKFNGLMETVVVWSGQLSDVSINDGNVSLRILIVIWVLLDHTLGLSQLSKETLLV